MITNNNFSWKDYLIDKLYYIKDTITPSIYGVLHIENEEYIFSIYITWLKWSKDVIHLTIYNGEDNNG